MTLFLSTGRTVGFAGIAASVVALLTMTPATRAADAAASVSFGRDVLPILSTNCFQCHGPDQRARKAKLRLDRREGVLKVVTPGKSDASELIRRINAEPGDGLMPPRKSNRRLTASQKDLLRRWIDEGAAWSKHWAYETPVRPALPAVKETAWPRNAIDRFVLARLEQEGLRPLPEAARETLIRRVTLDLTGLPPTVREVQAFLADSSPDAYEKVVDRLLASPRYGERMALDWLDDARYADTNGYQNDFARTMWPWRDWVIGAFNRNMPFDQFTTLQLAGDLLPNPTPEQKIATGFNRNNRTVTEAGSIDEEWRIENAIDRVETTATVFLGLTMGCGRCHDHKFDPISQKEMYQFLAFFNSVNEKGVYTEQRGNVPPLLSLPSPEDRERLRQLDAAIAAAEKDVRHKEAARAEKRSQWEKEQQLRPVPATPAGAALSCPLQGDLRFLGAGERPHEGTYRGKGKLAWTEGPLGKALSLDGDAGSFVDLGQSISLEGKDSFSYGCWVRPRGDGACLSKMDEAGGYRGFDLLVMGGKVEVHFVHHWPDRGLKVVGREVVPRDAWTHVFVTHDGSGKAAGVRLYLNGRPVPVDVHNDSLQGTIATTQPLRLGKRSTGFNLKGDLADVRFYRRALSAAEVQSLAAQPVGRIVRKPAAQRSKLEQGILDRAFGAQTDAGVRGAKEKVEQMRKQKADFEQRIPTVMVMEDLKTPRETYVLKRGQYDMPDKKQKVEPGVPAVLPSLPSAAPRSRLGLARWLVSPENPLTARVIVNRYWQHYFGVGLVKTAENFGVQSEPPSHPQLLDWLATEFVRTGWNVKAMQRLIVTSAAYRQSSSAAPDLVQGDPENRLLARGPRFRLPAEVVRDNALAVSGLLAEKLGGPSVKPYQPAGLWEELAGGAGEGPYVQDHGPGLYRRSLYVYRKRTVPHPALATFDAPSREVCQVKRARTNTPLQALELLNDVTHVEAARALAQLMLTEGGPTPEERLAFAFRRATARLPDADELRILKTGLERHRQTFEADRARASQLVRHGESPVDSKLDAAELAAYTAIAGVILNLDETITRE
jgi:hypothetical protein